MVNGIPSKNKDLSITIEEQTKRFIAGGGKIVQCGSEANANLAQLPGDFTVSKIGRTSRTGVKKKPTNPNKVK